VRIRNTAATAAALFLVAVPAAVAAKPVRPASARAGRRPLSVQTSSLAQAGRQVVWTVDLDHPFSPAALGRDHRALCLLIEREQNGSVAGELCVTPPAAGGRNARLEYERITRTGPGPANLIAATISRTGSHDLTATFSPSSIGLSYRPLRWQVISTLRPPACRPPAPNRIGCFLLFPDKPMLTRLHTPKLVGCVPSGSPFVNSGPVNRRVIALTFDDGPWVQTVRFLDVLERMHVVATFFEIGEQISTYGEHGAIERRMLADGDMIGDHTWSHINVAGAGPVAASQISRTADAIRQATGGFEPCLFRAPGGAVSGALIAEARSMGFTTIQWNVDPRDWARPGTNAVYENVVTNARSGSIVLQHDGGGDRSETLAALPREIDTFRREGYSFVTVTQLLGQRLVYK
jgi:peptidoglycan/xylan/chitin deacetylase (PgdA/CDA1 family)